MSRLQGHLSGPTSMTFKTLAMLVPVIGIAFAAPTDPGSAPITTSLVVVSSNLTTVTFRASQVSDASEYSGITGSTTVIVNGYTSTIYPSGFVWIPDSSKALNPPVPAQFIPSTSSVESTIVVTATIGTPLAVITYSASQVSSWTSMTAKTTSDGTTVFPHGWIWAPVPPPEGVPPPPELPAPPPEATPSEAGPSGTSNSEQTCPSMNTPTITVIISYPMNSDGIFQTTTETLKSSGDKHTCVVPGITTSTTASVSLPSVFSYLGTLDGGPIPSGVYPTVAMVVQDYLDGVYDSLGIGTADYAASTSSATPAEYTCADNTYNKAIPSAAAFIAGLSPSFCSDWSASPTNSLFKNYSASDVKSKSKREASLRERTPPPAPLTSNSYPGWSIEFDWKPGQPSEDCLNQKYCNNALSSLLAWCEGYSLADAYKGGSTQDDCGTFSYSIEGYPTAIATLATTSPTPSGLTCDLPTVPRDSDSDYVPRLYPQNAYEAAAHQYCYGNNKWEANPSDTWSATTYYYLDTTTIDPTTDLPAYCYASVSGLHGSTPSNANTLCHGNYLFHSNCKIWVQVVPSPVQDGCSPITRYKLPEGDECYANLMGLITTCMPADVGGKVGVWKEPTAFGCWDWWMWGRVNQPATWLF